MNTGDVFKLKPKARTKWLAFGKYKQGPVIAVRCDSEVGRLLLEWMKAGKPVDKQPCSWRHVTRVATEFYEHDLTQAVIVRLMQ